MAVLRRVKNPHFDLPFRFGSGVALVSQDTYDDVANCVEAIIRTELGFRYDVPDFGLPILEFQQQPIPVEDLIAIIEEQEPRAEILVEQNPDFYDEMIARIKFEVLPPGEV